MSVTAVLYDSHGKELGTLTLNEKTFKTGNVGYFGNGRLEFDGIRYVAQCQLVAIKSQGVPKATSSSTRPGSQAPVSLEQRGLQSQLATLLRQNEEDAIAFCQAACKEVTRTWPEYSFSLRRIVELLQRHPEARSSPQALATAIRRGRLKPPREPLPDLPASSITTLRIKSLKCDCIGTGTCWGCGIEGGMVWNYQRTNHGSVNLCASCRDFAVKNSARPTDTQPRRPDIDLMDVAWQGGSVDSNRRKH